MMWALLREKHGMIITLVPEMVAHLALNTIGEAKQLWLDFRVEWRHKSKFASAVVHSLQAHLIHSAMTLFQPAPRSSSFSRSLVDSSCPNHQTPCWGTVERYKDTTNTPMFSLSLTLSHTHWNRFRSFSQIIDPFVEVEIIGLPVDCCKEQTRVVDDNGKRRKASEFAACPAVGGGSLLLYLGLTLIWQNPHLQFYLHDRSVPHLQFSSLLKCKETFKLLKLMFLRHVSTPGVPLQEPLLSLGPLDGCVSTVG